MFKRRLIETLVSILTRSSMTIVIHRGIIWGGCFLFSNVCQPSGTRLSLWSFFVCARLHTCERKKRYTLSLVRDYSIHVDRLPAGDCSLRLSQYAAPFSFGPSPRCKQNRDYWFVSIYRWTWIRVWRLYSFVLQTRYSQTSKCTRLIYYVNFKWTLFFFIRYFVKR